MKVAKETKTKLKKNNRSRKQERLRLRNSEDPADKRKKRRSIAGRQRAEKEGVRNEEERAARTQAASQGHRRRPQQTRRGKTRQGLGGASGAKGTQKEETCAKTAGRGRRRASAPEKKSQKSLLF